MEYCGSFCSPDDRPTLDKPPAARAGLATETARVRPQGKAGFLALKQRLSWYETTAFAL